MDLRRLIMDLRRLIKYIAVRTVSLGTVRTTKVRAPEPFSVIFGRNEVFRTNLGVGSAVLRADKP